MFAFFGPNATQYDSAMHNAQNTKYDRCVMGLTFNFDCKLKSRFHFMTQLRLASGTQPFHCIEDE